MPRRRVEDVKVCEVKTLELSQRDQEKLVEALTHPVRATQPLGEAFAAHSKSVRQT